MPGTTDCRAYPFPLGPEPVDVAGDIQRLADKIDDDTCSLFATSTSQGSQISAQGGQISNLQSRLTALETAVSNNRVRLWTDHVGTFERAAVEMRTQTVTTDANGNASISFASVFATIPQVICNPTAQTGPAGYMSSVFLHASGSAFAFNLHSGGSTRPNTGIQVTYVAIGTW